LGLEPVLQKWGVKVGAGVVRDPENTISGTDVISGEFGPHPAMNPLLRSRIHFILPRTVGLMSTNEPAVGTPEVDVLVYSGPQSVLVQPNPPSPSRQPLAIAVERSEAPGVVTERGVARMVVLGDSILFGNQLIESAGNRDFANALVNWLTDRTSLLQGVGPRRIHEYRLVMTDSQFGRIQWILLGGLPAGILGFGGLIWLTRRN
jgi:hypothetical protein